MMICITERYKIDNHQKLTVINYWLQLEFSNTNLLWFGNGSGRFRIYVHRASVPASGCPPPLQATKSARTATARARCCCTPPGPRPPLPLPPPPASCRPACPRRRPASLRWWPPWSPPPNQGLRMSGPRRDIAWGRLPLFFWPKKTTHQK